MFERQVLHKLKVYNLGMLEIFLTYIFPSGANISFVLLLS